MSSSSPFFVVSFQNRWVLHFAHSLTCWLAMHDATFCHMEDPLCECGRPCDTKSSFFFICFVFFSVVQNQIGAGDSDRPGYRPDSPQDVPDQDHPMLPDGTQTIMLRTLSLFSQTPVEGWIFFLTPSTMAWCCRSWYMCLPLLRWRSSMYYKEHFGFCWVGSFFAKNRERKFKIFEKFIRKENVVCL